VAHHGVVHQDVDAAQLGDGPLDQPRHLLRIAEVGAVEHHVDTVRPLQLPSVGLDLVGMARPFSMTLQPSAASRVAMASPMPCVEPVTRADLSLSIGSSRC
jgi:hypothetical protein